MRAASQRRVLDVGEARGTRVPVVVRYASQTKSAPVIPEAEGWWSCAPNGEFPTPITAVKCYTCLLFESHVCLVPSCARKTVTRHFEYYPELHEFVRTEIDGALGDMAKTGLGVHLAEMKWPAIHATLKAKCPDEGWGDRVTHAGKVAVEATLRPGMMPPAELVQHRPAKDPTPPDGKVQLVLGPRFPKRLCRLERISIPFDRLYGHTGHKRQQFHRLYSCVAKPK
jgi:hypothetical protein